MGERESIARNERYYPVVKTRIHYSRSEMPTHRRRRRMYTLCFYILRPTCERADRAASARGGSCRRRGASGDIKCTDILPEPDDKSLRANIHRCTPVGIFRVTFLVPRTRRYGDFNDRDRFVRTPRRVFIHLPRRSRRHDLLCVTLRARIAVANAVFVDRPHLHAGSD